MKKILTFIFALLLFGALTLPTFATGFDYKETLEEFGEDVTEQSQEVDEEAEGITLPSFQEETDNGEGANIIVTAIRRFLDLFKLIVAPIAVLVIVIMGVRMVTAGRENEEVLTKSKNFIRYTLEGLIVIFMADAVVDVIFGAEGEIFRGGEAGAREFGRQTSELFQGIYGLIQIIIGSIAVFVLVLAGMRYVTGSASEDQIAKAKRQITWALVGLFIVGVSEFVAKDILFPEQGTTLGVESAKDLFAQVTNFIAGTIGTLSFAAALYAGYLYVLAHGNEEQVSKAKKILVGAVIGIILAASAFAITTTIVELDVSR